LILKRKILYRADKLPNCWVSLKSFWVLAIPGCVEVVEVIKLVVRRGLVTNVVTWLLLFCVLNHLVLELIHYHMVVFTLHIHVLLLETRFLLETHSTSTSLRPVSLLNIFVRINIDPFLRWLTVLSLRALLASWGLSQSPLLLLRYYVPVINIVIFVAHTVE